MSFPPPSPNAPGHQPPPVSAGADSPALPVKKPLWKRWWFIGLGILVLLIVIGAVAGGSSDDGDAEDTASTAPGTSPADDTTPEPADDSAPATEAPETTDAPTTSDATTAPAAAAAPGVGDQLDIGDGTIARVNSLTPNAEPLNEFSTPDPGFTFSRADVEVCAGPGGYNANPLYWSAFLDDNTTADVALGGQDFETYDVAPGGCTRGTVDFSVPDGRTVASVVVTGALLDEIGRWSAATATPVIAPLAATVPVDAAALGETVTLDDGHSATVRSVTPHAPAPNPFSEPDAGRQLVNIDVELCAGSEPLSVNPLYWLATSTDHYTGSAMLGAQTLDTIELAAGQCIAGLVAIDLPEAATPEHVILIGPGLDEIARWVAA